PDEDELDCQGGDQRKSGHVVQKRHECVHFRFSLLTTSLSPDQVSSTAQTLMSTSPIGNAMLRMVSSVMSVSTFDDRLGQDTHSAASCLIFATQAASASFSLARSVAKRWTVSALSSSAVTSVIRSRTSCR